MRQRFQNESGISLMEVLAAIVISGLVVTAIMSFFVFTKDQSDKQKDTVRGLTDISVAFKSITRDLRSATDVGNVNGDTSVLWIEKGDDEVTYQLESNTLMKNGVEYIYDVVDFSAVMDEEKQDIDLDIVSMSGKSLDTVIIRREGTQHE